MKHDILIWESYYADAKLVYDISSECIIFFLCLMHTAIHLHNQSGFMTVKISHEELFRTVQFKTNRVLTKKFFAVELAVSQSLPKHGLGSGLPLP